MADSNDLSRVAHASLKVAFNIAYLVLFISFAVLAHHEYTRRRNRVKHLPGPPGLPIVGNLLQVRGKPAYELYRQWAKLYGPVFQVQFGTQTLVIVNDTDAAKELFITKHAAVISRPVFYTFHNAVDNSKKAGNEASAFSAFSIGTSPWDLSTKKKRRAAATALNIPAVQSYAPILDFESKEFMRILLEETDFGTRPVLLRPLLYHMSLNMSLTLNYGTRILTHDSPLFREMYAVEKEISRLRSTSENFDDFFPFLRYNPFRKESTVARDISSRRRAVNYRLLDELSERVAKHIDRPCIQGNVFRDPEAKLTKEELLGISLSIVAGADSSTPTLGWITAYLISHPEWQTRLYNEIVRTRAEEGYDFTAEWGTAHDAEVPLLDAFIKEILRFYPPLRTGIPRAAYKNAAWGPAHIQEGTEVLLNIWACNRDPTIFEDPEEFKPERWLNPVNAENANYRSVTFGLGARMCPASFLTFKLLHITLVRMLWSFHIEAAPGTAAPSSDPIAGVAKIASLGSPPADTDILFRPRNRDLLIKLLGDRPGSFGGLKSQ